MTNLNYTKPVQTVSGDPVEIITTKGRGDYPVVGYRQDAAFPDTWTLKGEIDEGNSDIDYNLINVPQDSKIIVRWFNVYSNSYVEDFSTKGDADINAMKTRIACKRIEFTEGEFDGDE